MLQEFLLFVKNSWKDWQQHCWGDCSPRVELFGVRVSQKFMSEAVKLLLENNRSLMIPNWVMMSNTKHSFAEAKNAEREFFRKLYQPRRF